jgi:NAD+ kinase
MEKFYIVTKTPSLWDSPLVKILKKQDLVTKDPAKASKGILVFGGDGTMLRAIRELWKIGLPFSGFNFGHVGFLMNEPTEQALSEIISDSRRIISVRLLQAQLYDNSWEKLGEEMAFNEFYVEKANLLQTAAAAGGEILPIEAEKMVLTGIAPAVFHRWRSSILSKDAEILFEAIDMEERPVMFVSDNKVLPGVAKASINYSDSSVKLVFAASQDLREKVLRLKF